MKDLMFLRCVVGAIAGLYFFMGFSENEGDKIIIGFLLVCLGIFIL